MDTKGSIGDSCVGCFIISCPTSLVGVSLEMAFTDLDGRVTWVFPPGGHGSSTLLQTNELSEIRTHIDHCADRPSNKSTGAPWDHLSSVAAP